MFEFFSKKSFRVTKKNGRSIVIVDGKDVTPQTDDKVITIIINGNPDSVNVDVCESLTINGTTNHVESQTGSINIKGDVNGNVESGTGDIKCGNVSGNVESSTGDINCENVSGKVESSTGDISYKK